MRDPSAVERSQPEVTPPHYDLILALDPRFPGGTSTAISRELETLLATPLSLAVVRIKRQNEVVMRRGHLGLAPFDG